MKDKLICPSCGGEMTQNTVGITITLFCKNSKCDRAGVLYSPETIKDAQKCAVLQKKLDKAIAVIADVIEVLGDSWCCTTGDKTTVSDALFTKANDMLCNLITDLAIKKEIEDIKVK